MGSSLWDIIAGKSGGNGPSVFDYGNDLMAAGERQVTGLLGMNETLDWAAKSRGYSGLSGGKGDAMRHILLSAELQRSYPRLAGPLLYGHEYVTNVLQGQTADDREQDLYNNQVGRDIGRKAKSREEIEQMARGAVDSGKAKVLQRSQWSRD